MSLLSVLKAQLPAKSIAAALLGICFFALTWRHRSPILERIHYGQGRISS